ncbi:MAG: tRNA (N6-threonylcarbamoyladenosine(37)-N6)-methyltransferase TrmO [Deltaproteobacteria bacterium]|nr:tRNA (N6-threonylcarbamoyladenosine(37)-N6)-methyltransferase TrmO [Deltaproteobacteria bacterium]
MNCEPIGIVRSPVIEPVDENWGNVVSEIHLKTSLATGLRGIDQFSHVVVIFFMHQSTFDLATDLVRRPRGRPDMPLVGAFAQRAKHRPNPIGVTAVRLISVQDNVLIVKGLDAIDGTPVLDVKPFVPAHDTPHEAVNPDWMDRLMEGYF